VERKMSRPVAPVLDPRFEIDDRMAGTDFTGFLASLNPDPESRPVLNTGTAAEIRNHLPVDMPVEGIAPQEALAELSAVIGTYYRKNNHPGVFAHIASPGLPTDPLAHALVARLNQNTTGFRSAPGATEIERLVVRWISNLAGFPETSDGLFLAGGSWSNLTALMTAIHGTLGEEGRISGFHGRRRPVVLAAESVHFSVTRAVTALGLGSTGLISLPVDSSYRLDCVALESALEKLKSDDSRQACCVVASAGTSSLGAIDQLDIIAGICRKHQVWFHVDAAYGGAALLSDRLRKLLTGIGNADSVSIDLHKWAYLAFDASVLLYRNPAPARKLFDFEAEYAHYDTTPTPETYNFFTLSPEVSRRARAVPAYLAWRIYGQAVLGRNIEHNADCAAYLAGLVDQAPDLELITPPFLSICCFRYLPERTRNDAQLANALNRKLADLLNESGEFLFSDSRIGNKTVLRVCICSYRTRARHMEALVNAVLAMGQRLLNDMDV